MPASLPPRRFLPKDFFTGSFLPNALLRSQQLTPATKLVWARLAQYGGDVSWPSLATLADETGMDERTVRRAVVELEGEGFVDVERPAGRDRLAHRTTRYRLLWHASFGDESGDGKNVQSGVDSFVTSGVDILSTPQEEIREKEIRGRARRTPRARGATVPEDELARVWNAARGGMLPVVMLPLSPTRRAKVRARLRAAPDLVRWHRAIARAAASSFCNGKGANGWVANFDPWLLRPDTLAKIEEGVYDDRAGGTPADPSRAHGHGGGYYDKATSS